MKTKAIILPAIFILIIAPFMLFAQQQETIISADQISIHSDNILQAKGNVSQAWGYFNSSGSDDRE